MRIERHPGPAAFLEAAGAWLVAREAVLNVPYAIADGLARRGLGHDAYFATAHDDAGSIVGVAVLTPPRPLIVFDLPPDGLALLCDDLDRHGFAPTGVSGPVETATAFAEAWCAGHGRRARTKMELRAHVLECVQGTRETPGAMRLATLDDVPQVAAWIAAFQEEAGADSHEDPIALARRGVEREAYVFWVVDGAAGVSEVVSMAAIVGRTPNGRRIGAVYTAPVHRRSGYGEALVAALSARVLANEARFCFLYTDLANPTSNAIYRRIGYRPVGDVREIDLVP